jgi:hypothetical protein
VIHDDQTFEGYWWRPGDPDTKLAGTLSFSQDEVRLELLGAFEDPKPGPTDLADEARLHGVTKDRKLITVENNLGLGVSFNSPGFPVSKYGPHIVLVGALYEPGEEVRFEAVTIRFSDLDVWAATSGFKQDLRFNEDRTSAAGIDVTFTPPESVDVVLDDDTTLSVTWSFTWGGMTRVTTESSITQRAQFRVAFARGATIPETLGYVFQLRNFLSLGVGRPIQLLAVTGIHAPTGEGAEQGHPAPVEVLYRVIGRLEGPQGREPMLDELLFSLGEVLPRKEEIFRSWFERQDVVGPVFNRYFYVVHNRTMAREIQFESYVRALETYDRRSSNSTQIPADEHDARMAEIVASIPEAHREWVLDELRFSNEPKLAARLKATLKRCPTVSKRLIGNSDARGSFVRKVAVTRNYEVHLDPDNEAEAATGVALVILVYQLRVLVETTLLLDLGFAEDKIHSVFERIGRYREIDGLRDAAEKRAALPG